MPDAMNLGEGGKAVAFVYVADRERALAFYRDRLGLPVESSDPYGDYLRAAGSLLRLMVMPDLKPHAHPVLGFDVPDVAAAVRALNAGGVEMEKYEGMGQDELGVSTMPDGGKLAFFKDPDGNALMLSQS
jgi:catechol 2,3-dioxygenase-like lactoylglutathione lyase family enzyme